MSNQTKSRSSDEDSHNVCCHYCRVSARSNRIKKKARYLNCNNCRKTYCETCVENHLGLDFQKTLDNPSLASWCCQCCTNECCCCFSYCSVDHQHCFSYRRTLKRHSKQALDRQLAKKRRYEEISNEVISTPPESLPPSPTKKFRTSTSHFISSAPKRMIEQEPIYLPPSPPIQHEHNQHEQYRGDHLQVDQLDHLLLHHQPNYIYNQAPQYLVSPNSGCQTYLVENNTLHHPLVDPYVETSYNDYVDTSLHDYYSAFRADDMNSQTFYTSSEDLLQFDDTVPLYPHLYSEIDEYYNLDI